MDLNDYKSEMSSHHSLNGQGRANKFFAWEYPKIFGHHGLNGQGRANCVRRVIMSEQEVITA